MKRALAEGKSGQRCDCRATVSGCPVLSFGRRCACSYDFIFCARVFFFFNRRSDARFEFRRRTRIFFLAIGFPFGIAIFRDLFHRASGLDRLIFEFFRNRFGIRAGFQNQPLIFFAIAATDPHKRPFAFCFFSVENEMKFAFPQRFRGCSP